MKANNFNFKKVKKKICNVRWSVTFVSERQCEKIRHLLTHGGQFVIIMDLLVFFLKHMNN